MEHQWTTTMVLPVPRWYRTVRQQLFSTGSTTNNRNNVLVLAMGTIVHVAMLVRTTRYNKEEQATPSNTNQQPQQQVQQQQQPQQPQQPQVAL